jgi:hypothetical protein
VRGERARCLRALSRAGYRPAVRLKKSDVDVVQRVGDGKKFLVLVPRYNQPVTLLKLSLENGAAKAILHLDDSEPVQISARKSGREYHYRIPGFKNVAVLEIKE